jgi:hypothetical protein
MVWWAEVDMSDGCIRIRPRREGVIARFRHFIVNFIVAPC